MKSNVFETMAEQLIAEENFAIGNDLVYLPEFISSLNPVFQKKIYTGQEIAYCSQFDKPELRYASTWAAKEAVYKSIKQLCTLPIGLSRIEIVRDKVAGKPSVVLPITFSHLSVRLSISHDGDYVWAIAITKLKSV